MYMLKSLTAKVVCDVLLDLFANVGVPKVMVSDCGTDFTSQLTRELLTRLGVVPGSILQDTMRLREWSNGSIKPVRTC